MRPSQSNPPPRHIECDRVVLASCEQMRELPDGCVDLTVTSPPYWNAIDYDMHSVNRSENYRPRKPMHYGQYLAFLQKAFAEVLRVHRDGSVCAVVIGTVLLDGAHYPLPFHFVPLMEQLGWIFHQDIVWAKCTGGVKRFGSSVRNPFPGYFYPNIMTEYILLFRKPGERKIYDARSPEEKERNRIAVDSVTTKDVANNIWHIAPVPPNQMDHPCPFPEEIPYRLIRWFTYENDLVLDPFCGIGTTLKVAANLRRRWIGYEIIPQYAEAARARVREPLVLRKQLIAAFEKLRYGENTPAKSKPRPPFPRRKRKTARRTFDLPDTLEGGP